MSRIAVLFVVAALGCASSPDRPVWGDAGSFDPVFAPGPRSDAGPSLPMDAGDAAASPSADSGSSVADSGSGDAGDAASVIPPLATTDANLRATLVGFGAQTTGGLGGSLYVVDRVADDGTEGTLRYALEALTGPTWIVFDPRVFPLDGTTSIDIETPLSLRDDVTIDGRGAHVAITKRYRWEDAEWVSTASGTYECNAVAEPLSDMGPMVKIRSTKNIILSHLEFFQVIEGPEPDFSRKDTQCFGDVIQIYNVASEQDTRYFSDIWIHHSAFRACGDECIGITRSSSLERANITLSNNLFRDSFKAIIIGGPNDRSFMTAVTLYQNWFLNVDQRQPRVERAVVHFFNNVVEGWTLYGVGAGNNSRVVVEQNVFRAGEREQDPWRIFGSEDAHLWARNNLFPGIASSDRYVTRSFPIGLAEGGPWYYDDTLATSIDEPWAQAAMPYTSAAGWQPEANPLAELATLTE